MKNIIKAICAATVISVIISMLPFSARCENLSGKVFRLHILANSDSEADQSLKLKVRDKILEFTESLYTDSGDVYEAQRLTAENLQAIANIAQAEVYKNGYDYPVRAEIRKTRFDTRYYGRVTMPAGEYEALRITIGSGNGHNWWCVMYPALCVGASTNYNSLKENITDDEYKLVTSEEYSYRFFLWECFEKICSLFS